MLSINKVWSISCLNPWFWPLALSSERSHWQSILANHTKGNGGGLYNNISDYSNSQISLSSLESIGPSSNSASNKVVHAIWRNKKEIKYQINNHVQYIVKEWFMAISYRGNNVSQTGWAPGSVWTKSNITTTNPIKSDLRWGRRETILKVMLLSRFVFCRESSQLKLCFFWHRATLNEQPQPLILQSAILKV